ncbi:hypothetical protein JRY02_05110 [Enterobacter roggenkampii]|nr:hypothetical protein [Enterobacter roggenkampii]
MYQDVLDALNTSKTAAQHEKTLKSLYSIATDQKLKQYIHDVGILVRSLIVAMTEKTKNKNFTAAQRKAAAESAKADKARKFILADSQNDYVKTLIDYCQTNI